MYYKFNILYLLLKSFFIKIYYSFHNFPSNKIDSYIRVFFIKNINKLNIYEVIQNLINPVSIIRYFEFDYVLRNLPKNNNLKIMDVSSPRFLSLYLCSFNKKYQNLMINPDSNDIKITERYCKLLKINNLKLKIADVIELKAPKQKFDVIISVSVIEHINGKGDKKAVKRMYKMLKPGGRLIITTHISDKYSQEFRNSDQYNLGLRKKKGKYFFQRIYDYENLKNRIIKSIGKTPDNYEIIEEKDKGFFDRYINKWIKNGLNETVNDPLYIRQKFQEISGFNDITKLGVIGMIFIKPY